MRFRGKTALHTGHCAVSTAISAAWNPHGPGEIHSHQFSRPVLEGLIVYLATKGVYNLPEEYIAGIGTVRVGSQSCGRAVEHKKPWIVTDMLQDPLCTMKSMS